VLLVNLVKVLKLAQLGAVEHSLAPLALLDVTAFKSPSVGFTVAAS